MLEMTRTKNNDLIDTDEEEVLQRFIDNSKEANNGDLTDTILDINDLLELLHNDPDRFILKLELLRDDMAEIHNLCPECGLEKVFVASNECEMYQSSPVGEMVCPNDCEA